MPYPSVLETPRMIDHTYDLQTLAALLADLMLLPDSFRRFGTCQTKVSGDYYVCIGLQTPEGVTSIDFTDSVTAITPESRSDLWQQVVNCIERSIENYDLLTPECHLRKRESEEDRAAFRGFAADLHNLLENFPY
jgi:hypothetical protein